MRDVRRWSKLSQAIAAEVRKLVEPRGVVVETTALRKLTRRMQFVLAKERQEADRRRIEAHGIADFQEIVSLRMTSRS